MKSMTVDVCVDGDGIVGVFFFDPWPNVTRTIGPIQRRVVIAARHDIDGVLLFIRDGWGKRGAVVRTLSLRYWPTATVIRRGSVCVSIDRVRHHRSMVYNRWPFGLPLGTTWHVPWQNSFAIVSHQRIAILLFSSRTHPNSRLRRKPLLSSSKYRKVYTSLTRRIGTHTQLFNSWGEEAQSTRTLTGNRNFSLQWLPQRLSHTHTHKHGVK